MLWTSLAWAVSPSRPFPRVLECLCSLQRLLREPNHHWCRCGVRASACALGLQHHRRRLCDSRVTRLPLVPCMGMLVESLRLRPKCTDVRKLYESVDCVPTNSSANWRAQEARCSLSCCCGARKTVDANFADTLDGPMVGKTQSVRTLINCYMKSNREA